MNDLFPEDSVETIKKNFQDYLVDHSDLFANYFCLNFNLNKLDENGIDSLLSFVNKGNSAFISVEYFNKSLQEKLEFTANNLSKDIYLYEDLKKMK